MTVMIAAALLMSPVASSDLVIGPAAYYAPAYDVVIGGMPCPDDTVACMRPMSGWDAIIATHARYGQIDPATFPYSSDGYYCVHPDHDLGERLLVINAETGASIACTVADVVAPRHEAHWRASVVIELSWAAFVAVDGRSHNRMIVVSGKDGVG